MNIPFLGSINWLWLFVGIVLGFWVIPKVTAQLGR